MNGPHEDPQQLAERVARALASLGCRGRPWIVYDAVRVYVETDDGVLGFLAVHRGGTITAEGMPTRGAEVLAHVQRELARDGGGGP